MERCNATNIALVLKMFFFFVLMCLKESIASNAKVPHAHQGVVTPFEPGDPKVPLNNAALKILDSGKPYQTQVQAGNSGRGLVVQDIDAPTEVVWGRILDYDNYAKMVPQTVESKNYLVQNHKPTRKDPKTQTIYTRMKIGFPVLKLEFFVRHYYYPSLNSLTWTLDYSRKSDLDDSCGYWYVIPHPDNPTERSRVYYSVGISLYDWIPKFVVDFMSTKALTDATGWVKKYSELEWKKTGGAQNTQVKDSGKTEEKRKKNPLGKLVGIFKRKKKNDEPTDEKSCSASDTVGRGGECVANMEPVAQSRSASVLFTRIFLVSLVLMLVIYNIMLFVERMR